MNMSHDLEEASSPTARSSRGQRSAVDPICASVLQQSLVQSFLPLHDPHSRHKRCRVLSGQSQGAAHYRPQLLTCSDTRVCVCGGLRVYFLCLILFVYYGIRFMTFVVL